MINEEYGVELTLLTSKFKNKIKEMSDKIKDFGNKAKEEFNTGLYMDTSKAESDLNKFNNQLKRLQKDFEQYGNIDVKSGDGFVSIKTKINDVKKQISALNSDMKTINTSAFSKLGQKVQIVGEKIKKIHPKEVFTKMISNLVKVSSKLKELKKNSESTGNGLSKAFSKGINSLKKFAVSLLGIRTIWTGVTRAANAYLSFDTKLSDSIQNSWNALGSLLAPMLEYVTGLFLKAVSYVNAFVQALTGINLVAKANSKALNSQSKSAKAAASAQKSLGSQDELNNLSTGSGGSSENDTPQITVEPIDPSIFDGLINKLNQFKELALILFEPVKTAWASVGDGLLDSLENSFIGIYNLIQAIGGSLTEVWTNGTGELMITNMLKGWTLIFDIVGALAISITKAWDNANSGTIIVQAIADIFNSIMEFSNSILENIKKWVISDSFQKAMNFIFQLSGDILNYVKDIAKWVVDMYNQYLSPVVDNILLLISSVIEVIGILWNIWLKPLVSWFVDSAKRLLEPVIQGICSVINGIVLVIKGVLDFLIGVFTGDWKRAWNGIKDIVVGIWDIIWGSIKSVINFIGGGIETILNYGISMINQTINAYNSSLGKFFEWLGFSAEIRPMKKVSIPSLDVGTGYVPNDTLAQIHQGEAVIPKKFNSKEYFGNNNNEETNMLLRQLIDTIDDKDFNTYLDGEKIGKSTDNYINKNKRLLGGSAL